MRDKNEKGGEWLTVGSRTEPGTPAAEHLGFAGEVPRLARRAESLAREVQRFARKALSFVGKEKSLAREAKSLAAEGVSLGRELSAPAPLAEDDRLTTEIRHRQIGSRPHHDSAPAARGLQRSPERCFLDPELYYHRVRGVRATAREPNRTRYLLDTLERRPKRRQLIRAVARQPRLGPIERLHQCALAYATIV